MMKRTVALGAALLLSTSLAHAGAVIFDTGDRDTASVALGVNNEGHLNFVDPDFQTNNAGATGLAFNFGGDDGFNDATSPGCLCEGWGVAITRGDGVRVSAFGSVDNGGVGGIESGEFGSTPNTATSIVQMSDADVTITHAYGPSLQPGVFQGTVTVTNNTMGTMNDLVYRRAMDWDIFPTEFDEFVTHVGVEANLEGGAGSGASDGNVRFASDDGFSNVDPLDAPTFIREDTVNVDFNDSGPDDHGSLFDFAFGELEAGESRSFNIFYGARATEESAIQAVEALNVDVYSFGQSNPNGFFGGDGDGDGDGCDPADSDCLEAAAPAAPDDGIGNPDGTPATFIFAFGGVGGIAPGETEEFPVLPFVPEVNVFDFPRPVSGLWFDPPFIDGFVVELVGDSSATFNEFTVGGAFTGLEVVVGGVVVGTVNSGELFDLSSFNTMVFTIRNIDPDLDAGAPGFGRAFPLLLDFNGAPVRMTWTGIVLPPTTVPLPGTFLLLAAGGLLMARRFRR